MSLTRRNLLSIASIVAAAFLEGCELDFDRDEKFHIARDRHTGNKLGNSSSSVAGVNCLLSGTHIRTSTGERKIESLRVGDDVLSSNGQAREIRWIGNRKYIRSAEEKWSEEVCPVRIKKDAFGTDIPRADLYISRNHRLYLYGMLIRAEELVDNKMTTIERDAPETELEYFHILVDGDHEIMFAEGVPSETLFYNDSILRGFENGDDVSGAYFATLDNQPSLFAPVYDYRDRGKIHMVNSHLRSALAPLIDIRNQTDRVRDFLNERRQSSVKNTDQAATG
jgi:hypothetical protein